MKRMTPELDRRLYWMLEDRVMVGDRKVQCACPFQREASYFPPVNRLRLKCDGGPRAGLVDLRKMDKLAQLTGSTCAMLMAWALANNMMLELLSRNGTGRNWNAAWRKSRPITSASAPITIA